MERSDAVLFGCGGAGNKLCDTIMSGDPRFIGYFANTSMTDLQSLDNFDDVVKNYICISHQQNGMGRDRSLGKRYAGKSGYILLDKIRNFTQKTIYLVTSLGGASGSAIASAILSGVKSLKEDEDEHFDKVINFIGILPTLNSSDEILQNTIDTWNEILSYNVINNMMFIDNNNTIDGLYLEEEEINTRFADMFDSLFDIPEVNGRNFDGGNLGRILNSKGCMYVYDLPNGFNNIDEALREADNDSVLAKMYKTKGSVIMDDGKEKIKCSFLGTSFNNEDYTHEDVLDKYNPKEEFYGYNEDYNLLLVAGCLPPLKSIQIIEAELDDREKQKSNNQDSDYSNFIISSRKKNEVKKSDNNVLENNLENKKANVSIKNRKTNKKKSTKKLMKKNLFDSFN